MDFDADGLVKQAKAGDKEALIRLVMDKKDEYYRLAYSYLNGRENSLDALQDMIIILFVNIRKLRETDAFYSWSKTILLNCCRKIAKKQSKVILIDNSEEEEYQENYQGRELRQDIMDCMRKLSSQQREAITLKYLLDMDYESISKLTGAPQGTVKSRVFNGLARLKELFGGEY